MAFHDVDRVKIDDGEWSIICYHCGKEFNAKRSDASFCRAACRVAHQREQDNMMKRINDVNSLGEGLYDLASKNKKNPVLFDNLMRLQRMVTNAIKSMEIDEDQLPLFPE